MSLSEAVEQAIREAIDRMPELNKCPEKAYCEAVVEACDAIKFGVEMRLEELSHNDEED